MPDWKQDIRQRLAPLHLSPLLEASIVEEVSIYLDDFYADCLARGVSPDDAYQQTLRELGSSEVLARELRQTVREAPSSNLVPGANRTNVIADLFYDLRYGARMLWKHRGVTTLAVLSLAFGI